MTPRLLLCGRIVGIVFQRMLQGRDLARPVGHLAMVSHGAGGHDAPQRPRPAPRARRANAPSKSVAPQTTMMNRPVKVKYE